MSDRETNLGELTAKLRAASLALLKAKEVAEQERAALHGLFQRYDRAVGAMIREGKHDQTSRLSFRELVEHHNERLLSAMAEMDEKYRVVKELKNAHKALLSAQQKSRWSGDALLKNPGYDPNRLLDAVIERLDLKNDAALCKVLDATAPTISNIRHRRTPVGAALLVRMHEATNMSVRELRQLMGDRRKHYDGEDLVAAS